MVAVRANLDTTRNLALSKSDRSAALLAARLKTGSRRHSPEQERHEICTAPSFDLQLGWRWPASGCCGKLASYRASWGFSARHLTNLACMEPILLSLERGRSLRRVAGKK